MPVAPIRNEWLTRAKIKKFKEACTIRLYILLADGEKRYLEAHPWEDKVTITSKYELHISGFTLFHNDYAIHDHAFKAVMVINPGDSIAIDLSPLTFVMP